MRKFFGALCMLAAVVMLCGAGWLIYQNHTEEQQAGEISSSVMEEIMTAMETVSRSAAETGEAPVEVPEMPVMVIDGREYIGYLEMPTIELKLPVMGEWTYPDLRIAPCRYWGSVYDDSLVLMAHNYDRHFGRISSLESGAPVQFIDAEGNIYKYVVVKQETLERYDVEDMIADEWDMTLFTCTYGGASRITVRLERVLAY